jgi:hypothetical protein
MRNLHWIQIGVLALFAAGAVAQPRPALGQPRSSVEDRGNVFLRFFSEGEWYFSWGYSKQYWAPTDIHVSQPSQGNDFTIHDVHGHDDASSPSQIFSRGLFGPQFNPRIGRFIDGSRTVAVEVSLDHSKYESTVGQTAHVTGLIAGVPVDANYRLDNKFFLYQLHNGANHLMVNAVYRYPLLGQPNETLSVAAIGKVGVGLMLPHTSDTILGQPSDVGKKQFGNLVGLHSGWWQLDGWTTGVEFGFRVVLFKPVYLELTNKMTYSGFWDLPAYQGTLRHSLLMNAVVLSLGFTYDGASHH